MWTEFDLYSNRLNTKSDDCISITKVVRKDSLIWRLFVSLINVEHLSCYLAVKWWWISDSDIQRIYTPNVRTAYVDPFCWYMYKYIFLGTDGLSWNLMIWNHFWSHHGSGGPVPDSKLYWAPPCASGNSCLLNMNTDHWAVICWKWKSSSTCAPLSMWTFYATCNCKV